MADDKKVKLIQIDEKTFFGDERVIDLLGHTHEKGSGKVMLFTGIDNKVQYRGEKTSSDVMIEAGSTIGASVGMVLIPGVHNSYQEAFTGPFIGEDSSTVNSKFPNAEIIKVNTVDELANEYKKLRAELAVKSVGITQKSGGREDR